MRAMDIYEDLTVRSIWKLRKSHIQSISEAIEKDREKASLHVVNLLLDFLLEVDDSDDSQLDSVICAGAQISMARLWDESSIMLFASGVVERKISSVSLDVFFMGLNDLIRVQIKEEVLRRKRILNDLIEASRKIDDLRNRVLTAVAAGRYSVVIKVGEEIRQMEKSHPDLAVKKIRIGYAGQDSSDLTIHDVLKWASSVKRRQAKRLLRSRFVEGANVEGVPLLNIKNDK